MKCKYRFCFGRKPRYTNAISNKNELSLAISNLDKQSLPSSEPFDFSDPLLLSLADEEVDYNDKRYFPKGYKPFF